jgi:hypothetical protein
MRRAVPLLAFALASAPAVALADDVPSDFGRLVLDTGRVEPTVAERDVFRLQIHGEEQLRFEGLRSFPLDATASRIDGVPGGPSAPAGSITDSLGQNYFLSHWFRITPTLQIGDKLLIVGQADLTGVLLGQTTHDVWADQTPRDSYDGFSNVQARWLYVEWTSPVGLLRVGQQPSHWGMGLVANDGDHPSLFGDYRYGNIVEQVLFATKPLGIDSPFVVALAGNLVYRDNVAILTNGDHAYQGIAAAFYEKGPDMLGVYGVFRDQTRQQQSEADYFPYTDTIHVGVLDVAGRFARPLAAAGETAYVFGNVEAATEIGATDEQRTIYQLPGSAGAPPSTQWTKIQSYGGAAQLGVVLAQREGPKPPREVALRPDLYGKIVASVEVGYASGDANPDGTTNRRFVFDPNHKVGLLLFDEVMRWQTARASTAAQDPNLANASRPQPGSSLLPTNGGVYGAQYVYPTVVYRPRPWLDLKGGAVIAQTTADFVDPYRLAVQGAYVNYNGGDPKRHDLGLELDGGFEVRKELGPVLKLQLGAQAGVLFPGGALADANGVAMKTPWIAVGRVGLQY